jgi:lipoate-protein ligase B
MRLLRVATFLDPVRYADGLRLLEGLAAARAAGVVPDTVLVLEVGKRNWSAAQPAVQSCFLFLLFTPFLSLSHPTPSHQHHPVYTLGRRGLETHLRGVSAGKPDEKEAFAAATGADISASPRGGEATWHGPGQAVVYPVLALRPLNLGARAYVDALEDAMIAAAARWGVRAEARVGGRGPGAWVGPRKIGAVGVRISRGVASHGIAFNACPDLTAYDAIIPCGEDVGRGGARPVTSLDEELRQGVFGCSAAVGGPLVTADEAGAALVAALASRVGWKAVESVDAGLVWAEAEAALKGK